MLPHCRYPSIHADTVTSAGGALNRNPRLCARLLVGLGLGGGQTLLQVAARSACNSGPARPGPVNIALPAGRTLRLELEVELAK